MSGSLSELYGHHEDVSTYYGTSGHVVDLDLDAATALEKLQGMVNGRWTDEWTRIVAIDVNTYNANYDIATVFRFKVEQTRGGQLAAGVETCSCWLNPYKSSGDDARMIFEGIWMAWFLAYTVIIVYRCCRRGVCSSVRRLWTWMQLLYLVSFAVVFILWIAYTSQDRERLRKRNLTQFEDMYTVCRDARSMGNFAALSAVLACVHLFKGIGTLTCFSRLWRVFARSIHIALQCMLIVALGTLTLAWGAMWLFGSRVKAFSTWYLAFGRISHSMVAGSHFLSVFGQMEDASTTMARLWLIAWVIVATLILANIIISILTSANFSVSKCMSCEEKLESDFPLATLQTYLRLKVLWLWKIQDPDALEPIRKLLRDLEVWNLHLSSIDASVLDSRVDTLVQQGATLFNVADAMEFFPGGSEEESYWRAVQWMKSISIAAGVKMQEVHGKKSTTLGVRLLTQCFSSLEEEILGLGLQLRRLAPHAAPKAQII
jgi:hypothetical protein